MSFTDDFGREMRKSRKLLGMRQEELAKRIGASRAAIAAYECCTSKPSFERALDIAKYLEISIDELLGIRSARGVLCRIRRIEERLDGLDR